MHHQLAYRRGQSAESPSTRNTWAQVYSLYCCMIHQSTPREVMSVGTREISLQCTVGRGLLAICCCFAGVRSIPIRSKLILANGFNCWVGLRKRGGGSRHLNTTYENSICFLTCSRIFATISILFRLHLHSRAAATIHSDPFTHA